MCDVPFPAWLVSSSSEGFESGAPPPVAPLLPKLGPACPFTKVEEDAVAAIILGKKGRNYRGRQSTEEDEPAWTRTFKPSATVRARGGKSVTVTVSHASVMWRVHEFVEKLRLY